MSANKVFGIDLGTTYSCISQVDRYGRPEVLRNMDGDPTTPSVVQFQGDDVIVGKLAKRSSRLDPDNVAQLVKRHIGEADWRFHAGGREWSAAGVSSLILGALAKDAERATGERVNDVVITVPAYFGNEERKQTRLAGELAGLNVLDLINEPTAAAYAYGFAQEGAANESILVYDLGGGTFDITIIALEGDGIRVVATDGDHELGGAELGHRAGQPARRALHGAAPGRDRPVRRRLRRGRPADPGRGGQAVALPARARRRARHQRRRPRERLGHARGPRGGHAHAARAHDRAHPPRADGGRVARASPAIDRCLLVGGSSKMPAVARRLREEFGYDAQLADPDLAVAKGAALYGQKKQLERTVQEATDRGVDLTKAVADAAAQHGMTSDEVKSVVEKQVINVVSRGFGIIALRDEIDTAIFLVHRNDAGAGAASRSASTPSPTTRTRSACGSSSRAARRSRRGPRTTRCSSRARSPACRRATRAGPRSRCGCRWAATASSP